MSTHIMTFMTLALSLTVATPAMAQDAMADDATLLERFSFGIELRGRGGGFASAPAVVRPNVEFALLEPRTNEGGLRIDAVVGLGYSTRSDNLSDLATFDTFYGDIGGRFGYEFNPLGQVAILLNLGTSLGWEPGFASAQGILRQAVTYNNTINMEAGMQSGPRLRLGMGLGGTLGYPGRTGDDTNTPEVGREFFIFDFGLIWRL